MPFFSTFSGSFTAGRRRMHGGQDTFTSLQWSPARDVSTAFWIDASDTSSYTLGGFQNRYLASISDKAGNATITINTDTTGPRVWQGSDGLNGKNFFGFESNSNDDLTTNEFLQASSGNHWAIGLFKWTGVNSTQDSFWSVENNTVNATTSKRDYAVSSRYNLNQFLGELDLDSLTANRISSTAGNSINWTSPSGGLSKYTWHIIAVIFNKAGNQIAVRVNGENAFTPVNDYDNSLTPNLDVRIFRNRANERMDGDLAEFFTVADIPGPTVGTNISNVEKAEGYLAHKWTDSSNTLKNILGRLDANHPYKNSAP